MLAMIAMFFNGIYLFLGSHLQALRLKREYAISQFVHSLLGILLTYFFVITIDKSINGIYYAAIVVFPTVILYQMYALRNEFAWGFSKPIAWDLLRFSLPMAPAGIAIVAFSLSDRILLNILSTQSKLGIYSVAFKFAFGLQLVIAGYSMAIHPIVFQNYRNEKAKDQMRRLLFGYTVIGALAVFLLSIFSMETVLVFTQPAYYSAYRVMPLLYVITWINGFLMFAPGIQLSKKTVWISVVICSALLLNVILAYYLIPRYNIRGAAIGTLFSTILYVLGLFWVSMRFYPYHFARRPLAILVFLTVSFVVLSSVYFETIITKMNLASKFSIAFTLLATVAFYYVFQNLGKNQEEENL
jgi:O-antigen/teichoic acid export membrane protein